MSSDMYMEGVFYWDIYIIPPILLLLVLFMIARRFFRRYKPPYLFVSQLSAFISDKKSIREKFFKVPRLLLYSSLFIFIAALLDPHYYVQKKDDENDPNKKKIPIEGIAIYLILDNSLSMSEQVTAIDSFGKQFAVTKIALLKQLTEKFIKGDPALNLRGRDNDRLGILTFSRTAQVISPLTLDHGSIIENLRKLDVQHDDDQRGSVPGYAIFKSANLIQATRRFGQNTDKDSDPSYTIKNSIIVLITDGFQEINPEDDANPLRTIDIIDGINYAKDLNIRVYMIDIDPKINLDQYADHRKLYSLLTQSTGGNFFYVDNTHDLGNIYAEIDRLEKSTYIAPVPENMPHFYTRVSFYQQLIGLGMILFLLFLCLRFMVFRGLP